MNVAFDLTVAPGLFKGSDNGLVVPLNARCKPAELRDVGPLGATQPIVEVSCASRNNELLAEFMRQGLTVAASGQALVTALAQLSCSCVRSVSGFASQNARVREDAGFLRGCGPLPFRQPRRKSHTALVLAV
jgi:hypothetical protein